jgi:hypothetical protein
MMMISGWKDGYLIAYAIAYQTKKKRFDIEGEMNMNKL